VQSSKYGLPFGIIDSTWVGVYEAQPRVRGDGRKRASLACGALLATLVGRPSTRALGSMPATTVIAESKFFADPGDGNRLPVRIRIFMPRIRGRSAFCKVEMRGVARTTEVGGEDTMQAVALAVRLVNNTLARRHGQGWRYYLTPADRRSLPLWRFWGHSPRLSAFQVPGDASSAA